MATIKEQEDLIKVLKFTPCTYRISLWGYGGEIVMGTVDRKVYNYFRHRRLSVSDYAWGHDYADEQSIPEEFQPFPSGSWYECDDIAHGSGVSRNAGTIQIEDENGETVLEKPLEDLDGQDIQLSWDQESWIGQAGEGAVVFVGRSNEKGTFFEGEIELTAPFDQDKLTLIIDEVDGEEFITSVMYDDEDVDNFGGSTDGKSSDFGMYLVKDHTNFESYLDHDSIEYPLTEWFPAKLSPTYTGNYNVKTAGKNSYSYQALWTGSKWINAWNEEEIKIKEWQGITYNPDTDLENA